MGPFSGQARGRAHRLVWVRDPWECRRSLAARAGLGGSLPPRVLSQAGAEPVAPVRRKHDANSSTSWAFWASVRRSSSVLMTSSLEVGRDVAHPPARARSSAVPRLVPSRAHPSKTCREGGTMHPESIPLPGLRGHGRRRPGLVARLGDPDRGRDRRPRRGRPASRRTATGRPVPRALPRDSPDESLRACARHASRHHHALPQPDPRGLRAPRGRGATGAQGAGARGGARHGHRGGRAPGAGLALRRGGRVTLPG